MCLTIPEGHAVFPKLKTQIIADCISIFSSANLKNDRFAIRNGVKGYGKHYVWCSAFERSSANSGTALYVRETHKDFDFSVLSTDGWATAPQWKRRVSCLAGWILPPHPTLLPKWTLTPFWRHFSSPQGPLWPHSPQNSKSNFERGSETARSGGRGGWLCFPKQSLWPMGHWTGGPWAWEGSPGVESFLTGWYPPFCVVFYPVLFCMLTFPVVCLFSLHLITKVSLCCSECLPLNSALNCFFLSGNGSLNSLGGLLEAQWNAGQGLFEGHCSFFRGEGLTPLSLF